MNNRRLLNGYRCQRGRGKSHYQIAIEAAAKLIKQSSGSSTLMQLSLKRHGLRSDNGAVDLLRRSRSLTDGLKPDEIVTGRFFLNPADEEVWASYIAGFPHKLQDVIKDAEQICWHEFDLLGSGLVSLGHPIDWHVDPVSGYRWPKQFFSELRATRKTPSGSDVKFPWELSRMQHLPTLGKAYHLTKDERYAREIVEQVTHWLDDNSCPYGVNWSCPMDVAIRILNIIWGYLFSQHATVVTNEFRSRLALSIFQHGQFILFNLEYGLRDNGSVVNGNHYLSNVVGLLHLGLLCPEIKAAKTWKNIGLNALIAEMDRQVYPDGVNFESSISYHRLVLELFTAGALICKANGITLPDRFWQRLERMFDFVLSVTRPDAHAPIVGDADDGRLYVLSDYGRWDRTDFRYLLSIGAVLFGRGDMKAYAGGVSEDAFWLLGPSAIRTFTDLLCDSDDLKSQAFPNAGLYVMRQADRYLLASCGNVGTDGVGNHKHNDLLSFELYAGDKPFIVDPGAYVYTRNPDWRNKFRSTAYHNTVVIDRREQNRFESKRVFAMKLDAAVIVHEWLSTPLIDRLDVEHTGYARFDPPVHHRRIFVFNKQEGTWEIVDYLTGEGEHTAEWYFHFDCGIELTTNGEGILRTRCKGTNLEISATAEIPLVFRIADGWVSRRYGHKIPAKVLIINAAFESTCRVFITLRPVITSYGCGTINRDSSKL